MITNQSGIDLIKRFEGCRLTAYKCPAGIWTIGFGHTANVKEGDKITMAMAESLLKMDLVSREHFLNMLNLGLNENQFSALISLIYNIGQGNFLKSPVLKSLRNKETKNIKDAFMKHVYGGGVKLPGLVKRREEEYKLFIS